MLNFHLGLLIYNCFTHSSAQNLTQNVIQILLTTSFSKSDDYLHSDVDLNMDGSLEQGEVQDANVGQQDAMQDADVGQTQDMPMEIRKVEVQDAPVGARFGQAKAPIQFRRGFRSQITLGEEIA